MEFFDFFEKVIFWCILFHDLKNVKIATFYELKSRFEKSW
jgi:hypothetical protein